jgi:G:T-mismatch repair DNA endonuclease (very short patch repair protein)
MSRIKAKDTAPELALRKALRELGYTGYRLHYTKAPARPDIAFVGLRVAGIGTWLLLAWLSALHTAATSEQ